MSDETTSLDVLYFGWEPPSGHRLRSRKGMAIAYDSTPWGQIIDCGLAPHGRGNKIVDGLVATYHKDGWTAIAFWDQSGDRRPGSNTAFFVNITMTTEGLICLARQRWPEVFSRPGFPIK